MRQIILALALLLISSPTFAQWPGWQYPQQQAPAVEHHTRRHNVHHGGGSQAAEREAIRARERNFCRRYPNDRACRGRR